MVLKLRVLSFSHRFNRGVLVFWYMTLRHWLSGYPTFRRKISSSSLRLQIHFFMYLDTLKMIRFSETSGETCTAERVLIPEDGDLYFELAGQPA